MKVGNLPCVLLLSESVEEAEKLRRILDEVRYTTFVSASPAEPAGRLNLDNYDLVVFYTGKRMDKGIHLLLQLQADEVHCGVVLVADCPSTQDAVLAMRSGCASVLALQDAATALPSAAEQALKKGRAIRAMHQQRQVERAALQHAQARLQALESQIPEMQQATMDALLSSLEVREPNTRVHSLRLRVYATHLASLIGYPWSILPHLQAACMLHDIGKIELPMDLLNFTGVMPAPLLEALRPHTWLGEAILNRITFLRPAARLVRHHHERWDGSGYPDRLTGENIPLGSRILAIVDSLDAITNEQTYRPAHTFEEAIDEISRWSRRQFDPSLVAAFRRVPPETWVNLREQAESQAYDTHSLPARFELPAAEPAPNQVPLLVPA